MFAQRPLGLVELRSPQAGHLRSAVEPQIERDTRGARAAIALAAALALPLLVVTRRAPVDTDLVAALQAAGFPARAALVERAPRAAALGAGLYLACAGTGRSRAEELIRATLRKAQLPEPLRVAHLVGAALVKGESRGRV